MKKILVINFFPAFIPPKSGGELRYFNMYNEMSKYYDVTLLSPTYRTDKFQIVTHSPTYREYRIPKEEIHDVLHMQIMKENICSEISALVCSKSAEYMNKYHEYYQLLYKECDIIIHESPYMLNYDMYFGIDNKIRIYNSYNVEYDLVSQMWKGENSEKYLNIIYELEKKLVENVDVVFAISNDEKKKFLDTFQVSKENIKLAPNGINIDIYENLRSEKLNNVDEKLKNVLFIGSAHPPNIEAAEFIIKEIAFKCPGIKFYIAGKCCDDLCAITNNVEMLGLISEEKKLELFRNIDIAINPMFSGAGTNLKILEYMSSGIPTVSTKIGVRGLNLEEDIHYIEATSDNFAEILNNKLYDENKLEKISSNSKKFINDNYSWSSIVYSVKNVMSNINKKNNIANKNIMILNDFAVDNPTAGGELRINYLMKHLSKNHKLSLICLNNNEKIDKTNISNNFIQISIPKDREHLEEERKINQKHWISSEDIVTSYMIVKNKFLNMVVENLYALSDVVILEHPYMVNLIKDLDGKKVIYESLNYEYKLKKEILKDHPMAEFLIKKTKEVEKLALYKSDLVVSVSEEEVDQLKEFSPKSNVQIEVIKNGVAITEKKYNYNLLKEFLGDKPIITFIGSGHAPNLEACQFIINELAHQTPEYIYCIIGSVCDGFKERYLPENVLLFGKIESQYKDFLLYSSDLALNPMEQGAGSNLKLAEYFAFNIPTITTNCGARGYEIENEVHAIICERPNFRNNIYRILKDEKLYQRLQHNAYEYVVENVEWSKLGEKYNEVLNTLLYKKRLLVVTYRYNKSPKGGAEVYLSNIINEIAKRKNYLIDIVTTDVGEITDKFRFSHEYTKDVDINVTDVSGIKSIKHDVDNIDIDKAWKYSSDIYDVFMHESRNLAIKFLDLYNKPTLLGGWYFPEKDDNGYKVWSSEKSSIFVKGIKKINIKGYSNRRQQIKLLIDNKMIKEEVISGEFFLKLDNVCGMVLDITCEPFISKNKDPRKLGVLISEVSFYFKNSIDINKIELSSSFKDIIKIEFLERYIEEMIDVAKKRDKEINHKFESIKGPLSTKLKTWLEKNINYYDVVLGHSTPFNTIIMASKYANENMVPVVLLPHFHMEDDYYHWENYYDAFRKANVTISAPDICDKLFFKKLGVNSISLPGGGIFKSEYENIIDFKEFELLYKEEVPFVLTLGRKSGGKNYKYTIDAIESLNNKGIKVNLVMIGKDEDGLIIDSPYVKYLGMQPREVVLSSIKKSMALVNMSESESFGIVILEAWMLKKPVIVNKRCAAFTELVEDMEDGICIQPEDLEEKILYILNNNTVADKLGAKGYAKVSNKYTWENISNQIEILLNNVQ